ncbi:hypothetical protein [Microbacterium album]|uniref:hypothetical protein n=1 Tax=Microbacterium album TaxID=2053191 RepID=UPI00166D3ABE|nr:hypothetical protein [Microbacterium album]
MTPEMPDLGAIILDAVLQAPGFLLSAIAANPGPWAFVGAAVALALVFKLLEGRLRRRRR